MKKDIFNIKDRVYVITGGLGQLGRQYCRELINRGARVVIIDRYKKTSIGNELNTNENSLIYLSANITDKISIENALDTIKIKWGVPHGLVNNAALDSPPNSPPEENGPFENYPETSWDQIMEVNVKGTFLTCQVIGGAMASKGRGSIVNISSIYGVVSPDQRLYEYRLEQTGKPFYKPPAYSASKSAILNLTRYLATYWAEKGVRVNTLTLGGVFNKQDDMFLKAYRDKVPLGRMADEKEYNGAIVFLLSDAASYMTGSNMIIDGGFTAW